MITICMIMMIVVTIYWLASSLVIQLFMMSLFVVVNSIVVYHSSDTSMLSYLMLFSIISGLVAVLAFVMMSEPNTESSILESKSMFLLLSPTVLVYSVVMNMEIYHSENMLLINQFSNFSSFSTDLYLHMFLFMALVLLIMLFVVDFILMSHGGTMLPMK
uniref:NADH dehydrogenase subunit 6 n=1 Tax=Anaticola crassicornis TaxID=160206 RepID=G1EN52_9NEOP|nr:NADH dehydrogenase subunit 6 [Anaticola crassicornis]AEM23854.1 NADH dehydrogenase subunit 6 [Anaticola crassicornis]